jgi:hypothetical protein
VLSKSFISLLTQASTSATKQRILNMNNKILLAVFMGSLIVLGEFAIADLAITLTPSSPSFVEGSSGYVDVFVSSNSSDALDSFLFGLNITGGPGAVFSNTQSEAFLTDSNYVFFNRSASVNQVLPATSVGGGGSTISVGDVSYDTASLPFPGDPLPFTLPGSGSPSLLARLEFDAIAPGTFNVDIDLGSSFSDVNFNNFSFSSTGSSFTVTAVPEPSSIGGAVALALGGYLRRRKRSVAPRLRSRGTNVNKC